MCRSLKSYAFRGSAHRIKDVSVFRWRKGRGHSVGFSFPFSLPVLFFFPFSSLVSGFLLSFSHFPLWFLGFFSLFPFPSLVWGLGFLGVFPSPLYLRHRLRQEGWSVDICGSHYRTPRTENKVLQTTHPKPYSKILIHGSNKGKIKSKTPIPSLKKPQAL